MDHTITPKVIDLIKLYDETFMKSTSFYSD